MNDKVNIVFSSDFSYFNYLGAAVKSVAKNCSRPDRLVFWVLTKDISEEQLSQLFEPLLLRWHVIQIDSGVLGELPLSGHLTEATYFRLLIGTYLPDEINKIIYLDCDLVVLGDILQLWNWDTGSYAICAVEDIGYSRKTEIGLSKNQKYFNAGVLIIDMRKWRARPILKEALLIIQEKRGSLHHDQDVLNLLFLDSWLSLPLSWNQQYSFWELLPLSKRSRDREVINALNSPQIVHYSAASKPWHHSNDHPQKSSFLMYLDRNLISQYEEGVGVISIVRKHIKSLTPRWLRPRIAHLLRFVSLK